MEEELNRLLTDVASSTGRSAAPSNAAPTGTLRNEDFRQLLSRKAAAQPSGTNSTPQAQSTHSFSHRQANESKRNQNASGKVRKQKEQSKEDDEDDDYGSNLNEILKNYRDRAEERRKGTGKDESQDDLQASNAYRAVPSDIRATADAALRRKQAIQESKYLGGDMEHTHLVKGLDYSLLHKVRSEIALREQKGDDDLEAAYNKESQVEEVQSDNRMVKSILRVLYHNELPVTNEMFRKGRMAYVVELEEDSDMPTTRLRSVHDCPVTESTHDLNTSNMLIQKLTQVLSYLRTDNKKKKKAEGGINEEQRSKFSSQPIFDDDLETRKDKEKERDRARDKDRRRSKPSSYFDEQGRDGDRERDRDRGRDRERNRDYERSSRNERDRDRDRRAKEDGRREKGKEESVKLLESVLNPEKKSKAQTSETEGYAECYPGGIEMYEAAGESDDEADYSKMDKGNRRDPVKRWDFDNHTQYEKYMESREAMPKAAYQFGVKTNDGRKTRKSTADKEKTKLDREFTEISKILEKRKFEGRSEVAKRIKY